MRHAISSSSRRRSGGGSGTCYLSARMVHAFYNNAPYNSTSQNDSPWDFIDAAAQRPTTFFTSHAGKQPIAAHWGGSGSSISSFDTTANARARSAGMFSYYSMAASSGQLQDLLNGTNTNGGLTAFDALATAMKNAGFPILFRPWWEFNGNWGQGWAWQITPGAGVTGISAANYRQIWMNAWQRMADIMGGFAAGSGQGTNTGNVSWYWCPNVIGSGIPDPAPWFPGTAGDPSNKYVDWVGPDGYNKNDTLSPSSLFNPTLASCRTLAPGKPLAIGETGVEAPTVYSGGKSKWITDFFAWRNATLDVKFINWYNQAGSPARPFIEEGDAQGVFGGAAQTAFAAGVSDPRYIGGGTSVVNTTTFPSGSKVPVPA